MAEFDQARADALRAVAAAEEARARVGAAVDAAARAHARHHALRRALGEDDDRVRRAAEAARAADDDAATAREGLGQVLRREHAAVSHFGRLADPREEAGRLPDDLPVLLLPLRVETRWVGDELLVRVYPDEWAVDSFEPRLSDTEVDSARLYWAGVWEGKGLREARLAAWRGLALSHGSGRAAWIVQQHLPLNPGDAPGAGDPSDVVLVVAAGAPFPAALQDAARSYWVASWRADGDAAAVAAAEFALDADAGGDAATVRATPPVNLADPPPAGVDRAMAVVSVAFLELPSAEDVEARRASWTSAPRAHLLPDRFVVLGYQGDVLVVEHVGEPVPATLALGPDPSADTADQLHVDGPVLHVPPELRWMVDFEDAVRVGMGFRVALDDRTSQGFDRLLVLGLRLRVDAEGNAGELGTLLDHHLHTATGLGLVPQGTPTNNSEAAAAGFDRNDDPDRSFVDWFERPDFRVDDRDWRTMRDGQWLAEWLGIDSGVLLHAPHADGTDQREARAANTALWPATWGYFLETMMAPVLDPGTIDLTRAFFVEHVSGRGPVPALRIGRQPYGVLPTTAWSRLQWRTRDTEIVLPLPPSFLERLDGLLRVVAGDWAALARRVRRVGARGDAHEILLDVLGLHAASVEFHQRYAESVEDLFNRFQLSGSGADLVRALSALGMEARGMELLVRLGHTGPDDGVQPEVPDILRRLFVGRQNALAGPLVDDRPLSETDPVRSYTDDGRNYLAWLVDAARTSLETLRQEDGFTGDEPPTALLYLMLRHALVLAWWDTSLRLRLDADVLDVRSLQLARVESPFTHVAAVDPSGRESAFETAESRWTALYSTEVAVTDRDDLLLKDYIPSVLGEARATRYLADQIEAIELLRDVPTARLERVLVEHLDLAAYRLDAWRLGLVRSRLADMRWRTGEDGSVEARPGVHVGAYAWLEDVRPEDRQLTPVELAGELADVFSPPGSGPLQRDSANGGYVHAPSLNHAATAAILRAGYLANATPEAPGTLAVNLSSRRVREALVLIEGIRNGQSLAALLGYQLERGLHDSSGLAEVDQFIYPVRKAFPLVADRLDDTAEPADVPIEALEARNVLDGLALVRHVTQPGRRSYPFGLATLPAASDAQREAIDRQVDRLLDAHDAIADLALAEGVHQAVLGNTDRVAATLDAYSKSGFPPEPEVVRTPRSGTTLLHRLGLHLRPGADPATSPVSGVAMTPRAQAEPALNDWLAGVLPAPGDVACTARWTDPVSGTDGSLVVTQEALGLQPVDLLHVLRLAGGAAMSDLDDRVARAVRTALALRPDTTVTIHYTEPVAGRTSFFEVWPLVAHLRAVVQRSRPLRATDVVMHSEATPKDDAAVSLDSARVTLVRDGLDGVRTALVTYETDLAGLLASPVVNRSTLLARIDELLDTFVDALDDAGRFGLPGAAWGSLLDWRRATYASILAAVAEVAGRMRLSLERADDLIAADDLGGTLTDEERFALLQQAERLLSTTPTIPRPASPADLRMTVDAARAAYATRLTALDGVAGTSAGTLHALLDEARALLPLSGFVAEGLDITPFEDRVITFCGDLLARATSIRAETDARIAAADARVADHAATAVAQEQVDALVAATKALLGPDTVVVPHWRLPAAHAGEWQLATDAGRAGTLTSHLTGHEFPVDDWLAGVARVREPLRHWEQAVLLAGALGRPEPALTPAQLPHVDGEGWLALELAAGYTVSGDHLLYSAHHPEPLVAAGEQCGLLLDEWTEVLPGSEETTGLTFHYDKPSQEPPQAMLLVVPPVIRGQWQWDDLVASLHETLDLACTRAVEPSHVDTTRYAQFLPATVTAATARGISIAVNYAVNNTVSFSEMT